MGVEQRFGGGPGVDVDGYRPADALPAVAHGAVLVRHARRRVERLPGSGGLGGDLVDASAGL